MFRQFLFLTFILTQTFIFAQKTQKNQSEKRIWENDNNSLEIRFKALDEFYLNNHLQDLDSALIYVDYHLQLAKTHKKQSQLFEASKRKGNILRLKGLYPQAMRAYTKAEELAKILNNNIFNADILGNKGNVYIYQSDYIHAINNFSDALDIYKKIDHNEGINRMLTSLGTVFLLLQDYPKALEYFDLVKKNLAATKQVDRTKGILLINMGWANYKLSKWEEAQTCYFSGLDILLKENALLYVGDLYLNLAVLYRDLNQYKKAFYYVNKSLELNLKFGVSTSILDGKLILAELISKDNPKDGLALTLSIASEIFDSKDNRLLNDLYRVQYSCYKQMGKSELALAMHEKYISYNDSLQKEVNAFNAIRVAYKKDIEMQLSNAAFQSDKEKREIRIHQLKQTILLIIVFFSSFLLFVFYIQRTKKKNLKARERLLKEIEKLKKGINDKTIDHAQSFELNRMDIEQSIGRKLNETDWKVLSILLEDSTYSNKEIAEKAFMSVDGIGSSLRRMYVYFEIKESKYKKIALIMAAIKASN